MDHITGSAYLGEDQIPRWCHRDGKRTHQPHEFDIVVKCPRFVPVDKSRAAIIDALNAGVADFAKKSAQLLGCDVVLLRTHRSFELMASNAGHALNLSYAPIPVITGKSTRCYEMYGTFSWVAVPLTESAEWSFAPLSYDEALMEKALVRETVDEIYRRAQPIVAAALREDDAQWPNARGSVEPDGALHRALRR